MTRREGKRGDKASVIREQDCVVGYVFINDRGQCPVPTFQQFLANFLLKVQTIFDCFLWIVPHGKRRFFYQVPALSEKYFTSFQPQARDKYTEARP